MKGDQKQVKSENRVSFKNKQSLKKLTKSGKQTKSETIIQVQKKYRSASLKKTDLCDFNFFVLM